MGKRKELMGFKIEKKNTIDDWGKILISRKLGC
jgi:hypothetical protein